VKQQRTTETASFAEPRQGDSFADCSDSTSRRRRQLLTRLAYLFFSRQQRPIQTDEAGCRALRLYFPASSV
jgi:hypothetical protein